MIVKRFPNLPWTILAVSCVLSGCSQSDRPATYPVRGTVSYQGEPVAGAAVAFLAPGAPRIAGGMTDEAGRFRLTTFEPDDGAIAGTHVVTVEKITTPPQGPSYQASPDGRIDHAAIERAMQEQARLMQQAEKTRSELPAKYARHDTSDLRLEVVDGPNEFSIELTD